MCINAIDLSGLPKFGRRGISWKNSIGYTLSFTFEGKEGQLKILSYNKTTKILTVEYMNSSETIHVSNLVKCNLSYIVGKRKHDFYYEKNKLVSLKYSTIKILEQKKISGRKKYKYICTKCGYIGIIYEQHLRDGHGCPVCGGYKCLPGYNDIAKTHPRISKYFIDKEYSSTHSIGTREKGLAKCPNCGFLKKILPFTIKEQGFGCNRCSDGISFPAKFFTAWLCQLEEIFILEWSPDWAGGKKYDFYLPNRHIIVEVHGNQHYEGGFERAGGNNYRDEYENDKYKEELALQNGFSKEEYIVIDGRISEKDYLRSSIISSIVCKDLKGEHANWDECTKYAESSLTIKACELWESGLYKSTEDIASKLHLSRTTVIHMLTRGNHYGWCSYIGINERNKTLKKSSVERERAIIQYDLEGKLLYSYCSVKEAAKKTGCKSANIIGCARKLYNTSGGYIWRYADDKEPLEIIINKNHKRVTQYTVEGKALNEYPSVSEAAKITGISRDKISGCARGKSPKVAGGYIWRYENTPFFIEERVNPRQKRVAQYDLKGNKLNEFPSVVKASKATGIWKENIASVARGKAKTAGGYSWRYI